MSRDAKMNFGESMGPSTLQATSDLPSRSSIFGSKAITEEALQLQVDRIIIGGDETPDGKNFHFGLSLISLTNGQCIHFDPRPSFLDLNDPNIGIVAVEWRDHNHSQTNVNTPAFTMDTLNMPTAAAICRLVLEEKKLDQYRFTARGPGAAIGVLLYWRS
ncbi:hypothetical protein A0H81_09296 [Grifola frondosa]|uniref:DUF7770 domain-containing protein n=1 Tax=Grifola frondosa TaxID=5627 RepID=A0A1C7M1I0_GRIFR|nr:hypothetical protein A0H81_09296 [Grifola frondosa]